MTRSDVAGTARVGVTATPFPPVAEGTDAAGDRQSGRTRGVRTRGVWWLAAVVAAFALLQVVVIRGRFALSNDEVIYLSQLNQAVPAYLWQAWRAVGMTLLVAPVSVWNAPVEVVRWYLLVVSSLGLFLAYLPWLRVVRDWLVVPIAAGLFGFSYVVVYLSGFAFPSYYVALTAVAATGLFIRCGRGDRSRWALWGLAATVGAAALLRPSDSVWLVLPLVGLWLGSRRWRRLGVGAAIGAGLAVGWGYWLVEAWVRFPGPVARLREASDGVDGALRLDLSTVELYARMWSAARVECYNDGGIPCVVSEPIQPVAFVWIVVAAGFGVWGLVAALRRRAAAEVLVPLLVAPCLAFTYLFMVPYGMLRFLFPAAAVLAIPVAIGVASALRARPAYLRPLAAALAVVVVLGQLPLHRSSVESMAGSAVSSSASYQGEMIERLQEMGIRPPCAVATNIGIGFIYPMRCEALLMREARELTAVEPEPVARARAEGKSVAVVLNQIPSEGSYLDQWQRLSTEPSGHGFPVFLPPDQPAAGLSGGDTHER